MLDYSPTQLLFFFITYCFIGWIIESTYVSVRTRKLTNRGFMRGPVIPIYGFGAMMMLFCTTPFLKWPVAVFFAGMIGCSVLEYFTGMAMEAIFKVRYWDYSDKKFNINGHVCLLNSFFWGILSLGMAYFVHNLIDGFMRLFSVKALNITVTLCSAVFLVDLTLAFKAAFDLRNLIIKMEKAKDEMRLMQRRLDVMLAYAGESMDERKARMGESIDNWAVGMEDRMDRMSDSFDMKIDSLTDSIEEKFVSLKNALEEKPQNFAESMKAEYYELKAKFTINKENRSSNGFFKDFYTRGLIKGNPTISSGKFRDSLETIKAGVFKKND